MHLPSGCRSPYGRYRGFFNLQQVSQDNTNSLTAFHIWGHQKSREISSNILLNHDEFAKPGGVHVLPEYTAALQSKEGRPPS
jgi:hypothetical protein